MNARGIPPTAYQVLHLLSYPGGGTPSLTRVPPVLTWPGATSSLDRGYPIPDLGTPLSGPGWGTAPGRDLGSVTGVPTRKDMGPVKVLWDGDRGIPRQCEQTENITYPHSLDAGGKNKSIFGSPGASQTSKLNLICEKKLRLTLF